MLSVKISVGDQEEKQVEIPTTWDEIDYELYMKISTAEDEADFISKLLGIDKDVLSKAKIYGLENIIVAMRYITKEPVLDNNPSKLGEIDIPKDIALYSYDQYACFNSILNATKNVNDISVLTKYAAIYCQPLSKKFGGDFDFEKAMLMAEDLKKEKAIEVISVARFFLTKFVSLKTNLPMNFLLSLSLTKKPKPGMRIFQKFGRGILYLIKLPDMWVRRMMRWLNGISQSFSTRSNFFRGKMKLKKDIGK